MKSWVYLVLIFLFFPGSYSWARDCPDLEGAYVAVVEEQLRTLEDSLEYLDGVQSDAELEQIMLVGAAQSYLSLRVANLLSRYVVDSTPPATQVAIGLIDRTIGVVATAVLDGEDEDAIVAQIVESHLCLYPGFVVKAACDYSASQKFSTEVVNIVSETLDTWGAIDASLNSADRVKTRVRKSLQLKQSELESLESCA